MSILGLQISFIMWVNLETQCLQITRIDFSSPQSKPIPISGYAPYTPTLPSPGELVHFAGHHSSVLAQCLACNYMGWTDAE